MEQKQSDVLVLFGATGDLAYNKIFPALQAMVQSGRLTVPVLVEINLSGGFDETPRRRVELGTFWVDVYPVTNARFGAFIAAGWKAAVARPGHRRVSCEGPAPGGSPP